jgi:hypothetical protein
MGLLGGGTHFPLEITADANIRCICLWETCFLCALPLSPDGSSTGTGLTCGIATVMRSNGSRNRTRVAQGRHKRILSDSKWANCLYISKASNKLEEIESGMVHSAQSVYSEYPYPRREE